MQNIQPHLLAVLLAEAAAALYRDAETLPHSSQSERVLDRLFEVIADLELLAVCDMGPLAREVLGPR